MVATANIATGWCAPGLVAPHHRAMCKRPLVRNLYYLVIRLLLLVAVSSLLAITSQLH
jgi:hypothetical protein